MLKTIYIESLFDTYTYTLDLKSDEMPFCFITGPNGYGKTTILNLLNALYTGNLTMLSETPFKCLRLVFDDTYEVTVEQRRESIEEEGSDEGASFDVFLHVLFKKQDSDGIVLALPFGIVSDSVLFSNLGPNIPVSIHFIDSVLSQVKTNVTDYGINNVLLEVYLNVKISYEIVSPVMEEEKTLEYQLLMDSKVIQGVVPNWFSGAYQSQTTFFEVSFP